MRKLCYFTIALLSLCSCKKDSENGALLSGAQLSKHFITEYIVPSEIKIVKAGSILYLHFGGEYYRTYAIDKLSNEAKFFTDLYGDKYYDKAIVPGSHSALAYPIDGITISCNEDFNANYPAGKPLDEIVKLEYVSYHQFISTGYQYIVPKNHEWISHEMVYYSHCFDSITADMTHLIKANAAKNNDWTAITFSDKPNIPGEYTFNLAVTINGETLTTTFTHSFE